MEPLNVWLRRKDIQKYRSMPIGEYFSTYFLRDEYRPIYYNRNLMYAPADGIILYAIQVEPDKKIVSIKGKNYTIQDILCDKNYNDESIAIGIFMTYLDVHVNRMPTDGYIHYIRRDSIKIENLTMTKIEAALLEGKQYNPDDMEYMLYNERQICKIYYPEFNMYYYVVQVADLEVDVIANFYPDGEYLVQGSAFSHVRYGSQIDLIVPIKDNLQYDILVKDKTMWHVEAGIDPLVHIKEKD